MSRAWMVQLLLMPLFVISQVVGFLADTSFGFAKSMSKLFGLEQSNAPWYTGLLIPFPYVSHPKI